MITKELTDSIQNSSQVLEAKSDLNIKEKILAIFLLLAEIGLVTFIVNFAVHNHSGWDGIAMVPFIILTSIVSLIGIVKSIKLFKKRKFHLLTLLLLFVSIFCVAPPIYGTLISKPLIEKYDYNRLTPEQKAYSQEMQTKEDVIYQNLVDTFKNPQTVVSVENHSGLLTLENGIVVSPNLGTFKSEQSRDEYITWARENLIGKQVSIELFNKNDSGNIFVYVKARVFYKGEALDSKFKQN